MLLFISLVLFNWGSIEPDHRLDRSSYALAQVIVEVEVEQAHQRHLNALWPTLRDLLVEQREFVGNVRYEAATETGLQVRIGNALAMDRAQEIVSALRQPLTNTPYLVRVTSADTLVISLSASEKALLDGQTLAQTQEVFHHRLIEMGTFEPEFQLRQDAQIIIQVGGVKDRDALVKLLILGGDLSFNPVVSRSSNADFRPGPGNILLPEGGVDGSYLVLVEQAIIDTSHIVGASPSFDANGNPALNFRFNRLGANRFGTFTADHIGESVAIVLDGQVLSAPTIRSPIFGGSGIISGDFTIEQSTHLAIALTSGPLPVTIRLVEYRIIGPE